LPPIYPTEPNQHQNSGQGPGGTDCSLNHSGTGPKRWPLRILDSLFGEHAARLQRSLGKTTERQSLLLGNLANVNTPGYKRKDMDFSLALAEAENSPRVTLRVTDPRHIGGEEGETRGFQQEEEDSRSIRSDGNSVDMEREVAALTETQLHYSAVSLSSKRFFQGLRDVIREGK
jgi:flagellar basal-body rod protein FlgB